VNLNVARAVADAVLYEGYLLYPYRASSAKNRARWQFGVLGPPGAAAAGTGEASAMTMQCLLTSSGEPVDGTPALTLHLRCLHLQRRQLYDLSGATVEELSVAGTTWMSWDEAVEREVTFALPLTELRSGTSIPVTIDGGTEIERLEDARGVRLASIQRRRWPLSALLSAGISSLDDEFRRLTVRVENTARQGAGDPVESIRSSLIGAHLLVEGHGMTFVSLLEPPPEAREAAEGCQQDRCWPVLIGEPGGNDLVLGSPIILYDYPEIAAQSAGALFDATEIDEILTLRVMTMTDEEKSEARATDPRAASIIDRCDQMSPEALRELHGILRNPHAEPSPRSSGHAMPDPQWPGLSDIHAVDPPSFDTGNVPWWDPATDAAVRPELDAVTILGVAVAKGSLVRVHPNRRADAQDLFFADQVGRVTAVLSDVDGDVHVALVLLDDPAADLHEDSGRYFYFAPDELEPLAPDRREAVPINYRPNQREESRP